MTPGGSHTVGARVSPWSLLILATVGPLLGHVILLRLRIPLGCPGRLVYLYSPLIGWRLAAMPLAILLGVLLALGVRLLGSGAPRWRHVGLAISAIGALGLGIWSYYAPPQHDAQHFFNAQSPSQDGAFVVEAAQVAGLREYLSSFPQRARTPPAAMRGTRVISNPPGATLLAVAAERLVVGFPALGRFALGPVGPELADTPAKRALAHSVAAGLVFFWILTVLWLSAGVFLYWAGRLFFSPAVAAAYSLCSVFSPLALLFVPGKDPAQLLTIAAPLCFWLLALRRRQLWPAALAGVLFVVASLASLVHVWLAAIVIGASFLADRRTTLRAAAIAAGAALASTALLYVTLHLNLPATFVATARAQAEITRGPDAMPFLWQLLGVPLFLLFVGPAAWCSLTWFAARPAPLDRTNDADARLGRWFVALTGVVLLATAMFTNIETPRLWIPFVPLLLLGALLQFGALRCPSPRIVWLLAVLTAVQITAAALHWSLMDMRETEMRLSAGVFYG